MRSSGTSHCPESVKTEGRTVTWAQDLKMPGSQVDVNLHPTKREVGFLHQDALIDALRSAVEGQLLSTNQQ